MTGPSLEQMCAQAKAGKTLVGFAPMPRNYQLRPNGQYELTWDLYWVSREPTGTDGRRATHKNPYVRVLLAIELLTHLRDNIDSLD